MSPAPRRVAAFVLVLGCLGGLARADDLAGDAAAEAGPDSLRIAERAAGILQALRAWQDADADADDRDSLIETISELPAEDRSAIVHALAAVDASGAPRAQAAVLHEVLDRMGRSAVAHTLSELAAEGGTRDDRALLFWYARSQDAGAGLDTVLSAAAACDDTELASPAIRSHVRQAIAAELGRHEPAPEALAAMLRATPPRVGVLVLDSLENRGSPVSTRAFSALLGSDTATDIALLRSLARLPIREARPFDDAVAPRLPSYLQHPDTEVRRLAVMVAMRFRPTQSVETAIGLLDDKDAGVRSAAHRSLIARTGLRLLAERKLWDKWLTDERAWLKDARADLTADLGSPEAAIVVSALQSIRAHPLFADTRVAGVEAASGHDDADVRAEACAALAALGQFSAIPALARCLGDDEPRVAAAASRALERLTGLKKGPTTADEWKRELLD